MTGKRFPHFGRRGPFRLPRRLLVVVACGARGIACPIPCDSLLCFFPPALLRAGAEIRAVIIVPARREALHNVAFFAMGGQDLSAPSGPEHGKRNLAGHSCTVQREAKSGGAFQVAVRWAAWSHFFLRPPVTFLRPPEAVEGHRPGAGRACSRRCALQSSLAQAQHGRGEKESRQGEEQVAAATQACDSPIDLY